MRKNYFVIYDEERDYIENFIDYVKTERLINKNLVGFYDINELKNFINSNDVDVLLINKDSIDNEINLSGSKILILNSEETQDDNHIFKYQSIPNIIKDIECCLLEELSKDVTKLRNKQQNKLITVYSPVNRSGKTTLALIISELLGRNNKVIYLSLERLPSFPFMRTDTGFDISDLIYYVRQEDKDIKEKIFSSIKSMENFDFIPGLSSIDDARQISAEEVHQLLDYIVEFNKYNIIVLEIEDIVGEFYSILEESDKIYMPLLDDSISWYKINFFKELLESKRLNRTKKNIRNIILPSINKDIDVTKGLNSLVFSSAGDVVKRMLEEDSL